MKRTKNTFENFPDWIIKKWQEIADLLAETIDIPAALIMKTENEFMEVFISSHSENNPYPVGGKEKWHGLYCETVIKSQNKLLVTNAVKDRKWNQNPDIKLGMIAYLGFPLNFPDNKPFGTLCVLDNKERPFTLQNEKLIEQFKNVIELDLALLQSFNLKTNQLTANVFQEITERRQAEENTTKLIRVYTVLSNINQTILRTRDKQELFDKVCRIAVDDGGYLMAWIGMVNPTTNKVDVVASAGSTGEYLKDINIDLNNAAQSSGPTGQAIKSGKCVFSNNIETDDKMIPWRKNALKQGYLSSITQPIVTSGKIIGAYTMYSGESGFFTEEEIKLLAEMASNISFALEFIENEKKREQAEEELKESEEKFRNVFEAANVGKSITSPKGKIHVNNAFCEMLGYTKEELQNKSWQDLTPSDEIETIRKELIPLLTGELNSTRFNKRYIHKNGSFIWADVGVVIHRDSQGKPLHFITTVNNISERKRAEEALQENNSRLELAMQSANMAWWEMDIPTGKVIFDKRKSEMLGYPAGNFKHYKDFMALVHPEDADKAMKAMQRHIDGESDKYEVEYRIFTQSGRYKWFYDIGSIVKKNAKGIPLNATGLVIDITERKHAEEKIREKDIQFRKLSANLSDLIFQFTRRPDGTYYVPIASEGIRNIFGCSPEDVLNDFTPIGRVIYPDDAARVISDIEYSAEHLSFFTCEFRVQIPGKEIQWIFSRSSPEKLPDGSITWYGFNADITESKQMEQELIKAKERAEESDHLKTAFLCNMSHEIRTPMNGILGFAELLKEPGLSGDQQQEYISIIEKGGARMLNIINDIVSISKIESGTTDIHISETNINEQTDYVYNLLKLDAEKKKLNLIRNNSLPDQESIIKTDSEKFIGILSNLVKNAIKYTDQGSVEFGYHLCRAKACLGSTECLVSTLEFYIKDTGIGIPKKKQEAIFERFIQADIADKMARQGAGLGLAISRAYVAMLGGRIWVESEEGKGSTFYFTIPCTSEPQQKTILQTDALTDTPTHVHPEVSGLKILIAEDDETSELLISTTVKMFGKEILKVRTGVEAVEKCKKNFDIDLILMDIQMPDLNGYEATRQIRQFNQDVVIIAQTAFGLSGDREKALEAGCNDYISKPIARTELQAMIRKYFMK